MRKEIRTICFNKRRMSCKNKDYIINIGDIILFNPEDSHSCAQNDHGTLDYRALNIPKETMLNLVEDITNKSSL